MFTEVWLVSVIHSISWQIFVIFHACSRAKKLYFHHGGKMKPPGEAKKTEYVNTHLLNIAKITFRMFNSELLELVITVLFVKC